jgi:hypothetical protein
VRPLFRALRHLTMNHRIPALLLPVLALAAPGFAQGDVDLRTTAKKGSSVWLLQEQKSEQTIDMAGNEMEMTDSSKRVLHVTVKDVDAEGNLLVETRIGRIHGSMSMMGQDFEFDSNDPDAIEDGGMGPGMMLKGKIAGAGKAFTAKVSPFGKVTELLDGAAELTKAGDNPMAQAALNEGMLKQMVESAFGVLPEKPIAVGGKWDHTRKDENGRTPMEHKLSLTLVKADDEAFEISGTGTIDKPAVADTKPEDDKADGGDEEEAMAREMMQNAMKTMKVKDGKLSGTQRISRKDGFLLDGSQTLSMTIEMNVGQGGDMSIAAKNTTTTKRTTEAEAQGGKKAEPAKDGADKAQPAKEEPKKEEPKK